MNVQQEETPNVQSITYTTEAPTTVASSQQRKEPPPSSSTGTATTSTSTKKSPPPQSRSFLENQDEGVLNDVLEELDRERSKRAELEARTRDLEQALYSEKKRNVQTTDPKDYVALQTECQGYRELLDALTSDRPALSKPQKLPMHIVRLLEIVPWDSRTRPHLFGQEIVYEWQMYRSDGVWQNRLRYFPTVFKTLPIVSPQPGMTVGDAPTSSSPPKQGVLTNVEINRILNIDKGYPLPQDGGNWKWIGGWRIEKTVDTDDKGWSYSNSLDVMDSASYYGELRMPEKGAPNMMKRRRKWTRSRVLIDYPHASAMTQEYLKLVAEKASLDVTVEKLSNQLVTTKMDLTTLEAEHLSLQETMAIKMSKLEKELDEKTKLLEVSEESRSKLQKDLEERDRKLLENTKESEMNGSFSEENILTTTAATTDTGTATNGTTNFKVESVEESVKVDTVKSQTKTPIFDSLKGRGNDFFEKIKSKGGDEFERIKQSGVTGVVKLPWQQQVKEKEEAKMDSESDPSTYDA